MYKIAALVRASCLDELSYRFRFLLTLAGLVLAAAPFVFVARALQPLMEKSIQGEGGQYLGFVVVGMTTFSFLRTSISALPGAVGGSISSGTLEALLGTPTQLPTLLAGLVGYAFVWTAIRALVLLVFAWTMGADILWSRAVLASGILAMIIFTHVPFGIFLSALILAFRATGPIESVIMWISMMLGGVYYPTSVIPSWLAKVSDFVPLTYGLRALRRTLLEPTLDYSLLASDLVPLCVAGAVMSVLSLLAFAAAMQYSRRSGTLAQY